MTEIKKVLESSKSLSNLQIIIKSTLILTVSVFISLAGAMFEDAMLCDVKYFLEMDIFRGVKAAQLVPFGIFIVIYLIYFINKNNKNNFKSVINTTVKIMNMEIKFYYAIIAAAIAVVGYVYIARTGHETNLQPSNLEMIFRNFMEYELLARPRTKEFLIAFPALFAAVFAANKKSKFFTGIFMLLSAIGTSSVINTFSHLRTPIYLSMARTLTGLGFGIVIGCVLIFLFNFMCGAFLKIKRRIQ
jgi:hypothetical protein